MRPTRDRALVLAVEWKLESVETGLEWETLESFPCGLYCVLSVSLILSPRLFDKASQTETSHQIRSDAPRREEKSEAQN